MTKIARIPRVAEVEVRPPYGLRLTFDDGSARDVDLADDLWGPMFEPLKDPAFFAQVCVDHGTVTWPKRPRPRPTRAPRRLQSGHTSRRAARPLMTPSAPELASHGPISEYAAPANSHL